MADPVSIAALSSALRAAADRLDGALAAALASSELSVTERDALAALRSSPSGMTVTHLADLVIVSASRLEPLLAGLEAQQLIRHRPDTSAGEVAITVLGLRTLADHERRAAKLVDEVVDEALEGAERQELIRLLARLGSLPES